MKNKETLEEAAEKIYQDNGFNDEMWTDTGELFREKFIEGAKWQSERMYSELELFIAELEDRVKSFEYDVNQQSYISKYIKQWFKQFKNLK